MKKIILSWVCLFAAGSALAQNDEQKWNVGVHGGYSQYNGDLGNGFYNMKQAAYGFVGVSGSRYLTPHLDGVLMLTRGEVGYLASRDYSVDQSVPFNFRTELTTANLFLRYNFLSREARVNPFAFIGGGVINQQPFTSGKRKTIEFGAPTGGVGFNWRLNEMTSIQVQEMLSYTSADDIDHRVADLNDAYIFHTVGLTFNLYKWQPRPEGSRAGNRIDRCYEMKTGFMKKSQQPKKIKTKAKMKRVK